jgi:hypothetical protein
MTPHAARQYNTLAESTRGVAKDFLQTVVVVDDQATLGIEIPSAASDALPARIEAVAVAPDESSTRTRVRRARPELVTPDSVPERTLTPEQALDAKTLVDGFAEHGIVCGVIRPLAGDDAVERTVKAARRADIVVLDWELNADHGGTTLEIIRRLIQDEIDAKSMAQPRLRLIAVYSGALRLDQIASRIRTNIKKTTAGVRVRKDGAFALISGMARIVVFSKPTTRFSSGGRVLKGYSDRVINTADLPDVLINEFAALTAGLVPNVALASMAALRRNTHRVLAQLQAELDPAYLWHRATQVRPADAEEHLVQLVAGELHAVLEDERVGEWANIDAIEQWIQQDGRTDFQKAFDEKAERTPTDIKELLTKGAAVGLGEVNQQIRDKFRKMCSDKGAHSKDIAGFAKNAAAATHANEKFATLMSLRTRYENPTPRLELGTVVSKGRGKRRSYWLCVQPRCDSVRLKGEIPFPMIPVLPVNKGDKNEKFEILLPSSVGHHLRFRISKKPGEIRAPTFAVNPPEGDVVLATKTRSGFAFIATNRDRYYWEAELKAEHAQRIAQQIANEFSRVGLNESEWLRLWASKG